VVARLVAEHMAKMHGQPIVVENDPGAGGATAARRALQALADGAIIIVGSKGTHAAAPAQVSHIQARGKPSPLPVQSALG
jgi:tripartite-type tricarboxylate transporter receptor subunit TctC